MSTLTTASFHWVFNNFLPVPFTLFDSFHYQLYYIFSFVSPFTFFFLSSLSFYQFLFVLICWRLRHKRRFPSIFIILKSRSQLFPTCCLSLKKTISIKFLIDWKRQIVKNWILKILVLGGIQGFHKVGLVESGSLDYGAIAFSLCTESLKVLATIHIWIRRNTCN